MLIPGSLGTVAQRIMALHERGRRLAPGSSETTGATGAGGDRRTRSDARFGESRESINPTAFNGPTGRASQVRRQARTKAGDGMQNQRQIQKPWRSQIQNQRQGQIQIRRQVQATEGRRGAPGMTTAGFFMKRDRVARGSGGVKGRCATGAAPASP